MWLYLLLGLVALLVTKVVSLHLYWKKRGLPYESYPRYLYRVLWLFNTKVIIDVLREDVHKYGKVYGSYRVTTPSLVVADADVGKDVLIKQFGGFFRRSFEFVTGDPLLDSTVTHLPYEQWKSVRAVMGYAFTTSKMRGMIPKIDKIAARFSGKLASVARSRENETELRWLLFGYGMDSIVALSFGIDINSIDNPDNDFVKYGSNVFKSSISLMICYLVPQLYRFLPFIDFPPKKTTNFFGEIGKRILKEKRRNLEEVIKNGTADILDLHLIAQREDPKNHLTDDVLAAQTFLFFIGGVDPIVVTLQLCTYFLATNQNIQERVFKEIKSILGERTNIEYDDVQKMKFLEACLLESVRIVPTTFIIDRVATKDTEVAGIPIKKGTVVEFPVPYIHHDPKYFPEPEKFIPDRFLKDGDISSEIAAFLTFGGGPKGCAGRRLALMIMQIFVAKIVLDVQLEACSQTPVPLQITPGFEFVNLFHKPLVLRLTPRV